MSKPRTLFAQLLLILFAGLLLAHGLTFTWSILERTQATRGLMVSYMAADVASSIAMLDRLPPQERATWLPRLQRSNYALALRPASTSAATQASDHNSLAQQIGQALSSALTQSVRIIPPQGNSPHMSLELELQDGTPVSIDIASPSLKISPWVLALLAAQLLVLAGVCALAVRQLTRPLANLASAASHFVPGQQAAALAEQGPREVAQASAAFNHMRQRIEAHLNERTQMLAAISHDLQTPITRLRLRTELMEADALKEKMQSDLAQMQHLVEQGLVFARSTQPPHEPTAPTDLLALLESMAADYEDAQLPVQWQGGCPAIAHTRPHALRRIIANLIDNAIKFAGSAELSLESHGEHWLIHIADRGPGIPADQLSQVFQAFYRLENSRNPATGGSGLGLAIVQRLLPHCAADLSLTPRPGGGLQATLRLAR